MTDILERSPFDVFADWMEDAKKSEVNDPNAVAVATAGADGQPAVRMVLLKDYDEHGFVFYTNLESNKGRDLAANPKAAMLFHWKSLRRQVRIEGPVSPVTAEEADAYFASRARGSQIGAWASQQSRPMAGRFDLEKRIATTTAKYGLGAVPRPPHWSGFRVAPVRIEFWQDGAFRLHDRWIFRRTDASQDWITERLFP